MVKLGLMGSVVSTYMYVKINEHVVTNFKNGSQKTRNLEIDRLDNYREVWSFFYYEKVAVCVNVRGTSTDATTLQSGLEILESVVLHSSGKYGLVEQEVTPVNLIHHLQR